MFLDSSKIQQKLFYTYCFILQELAVRWYQFGAWMPFFRAHAHIDTKRREPWTFTPETYTLLRDAVVQRYSYLPYLYTAFWQAHSTGLPMVRPFMLEYPEDTLGFNEDRAFLFGDSILVVPVVTEGATSVTYNLLLFHYLVLMFLRDVG